MTVDRSDVGATFVLTPGARRRCRVIFDGASRRPDGLRLLPCRQSKLADLNRRGSNYQPARECAQTVHSG